MRAALRRFHFSLAILCGLLALWLAWAAAGTGGTVLASKRIWGMAALSALFASLGWRANRGVAMASALLVATLALMELVLQAAAWSNILPGINTKIHAPFARVYWTTEGRGNSLRNRQGWHAPGFDLGATNRLVIIGDSFVEAVEVPRARNFAALLGGLVRDSHPDLAVMGLGSHGTSVAHHREVLAYARRHLQPTEVILALYLGNDVTECSPALNIHPPERVPYYELDSAGALRPDPRGLAPLGELRRSLELPHRSPALWLPDTLASHCMLLQVGVSARDGWARRQLAANAPAWLLDTNTSAAGKKLRATGLNPEPFQIAPTPRAAQALDVMLRLLEECRRFSATEGIRLRLVTLPAFPQPFYESQSGRDWTARVGEHDYFIHDAAIEAFASRHGLAFFPFGRFLQERRVPVEEIRTLYFLDGTGHFNERGHRACAEAIRAAFFPPAPKP